MKTRIFLSCLSCFLSTQLSAQSTSTESSGLRFSDLSVLPAMQIYRSTFYSQEDFLKLAPNSQLLREDYSSFQNSSSGIANVSSDINLMLGLRFADADQGGYKANPQLRLGISFQSVSLISNQFFRSETRPYDTLVSSQTGREYYVDTTADFGYQMDYSMDRIGINGSLIWRTNSENRLELFAGVGAAINVGFNASTHIMYYEHGRLEGDFYNDYSYSYHNQRFSRGRNRTETFKNSTSLGGGFFLPVGLDYQLGQKRDFWKQIHIFYELRPGMDFHHIPELGTTNRIYFFQGIGLRYS